MKNYAFGMFKQQNFIKFAHFPLRQTRTACHMVEFVPQFAIIYHQKGKIINLLSI